MSTPSTARRLAWVLRGLVVGTAAGLALRPPSPATIERDYADGAYPRIQALLTPLSNRIGIALFDVVLVAVAVGVVALWWLKWRAARRQRSPWPIGRALVSTIVLASAMYLWYLGAWGFNYARPPIESSLPYDAARVTPMAVRLLAERAVAEANRGYGPAHAQGFPSIADAPASLAASLEQVEARFGRPRPTIVARPKRSLLSPFFRMAGVSGMLAPFFLETLVNPDLTGPERPVVLAHEWAHLAGHAPESDASYVGILAALGADPASQYSAWLDLVSETSSQLQPVTRDLVLRQLGEGPRADLQAINQRLQALVRPVERAAWSTYDQMLKSQGVEEGVRSYSRVIQLIIATGAIENEP